MKALQKKEPPLVRISGRLKIAQRFIAGIGGKSEMKSVKRTAERVEDPGVIIQPSASRTTNPSAILLPAVNCWATISRPLCGLKPAFPAKS